MCARGPVFIRIFLIGFGLVFLIVGILIAAVAAPQAAAEAARAARLYPLSAAALDDGQPGREALIEGHISARNSPRFQRFVAYIREEYRGSDDDDNEQWEEDERRTPPLRIEVADGIVSLANDSYDLDNPPHTWEESQLRSWNGFTGEGTKRYRGFQAGDTALAIGTLVQGSEGLELQAERVYGGTRDDYIAQRQSSARWMPWIGGIFGLLGSVIAGAGVWWLLRRA